MPVEAAPKESEPTQQKEKPEQRPVDRTRHERPERRRHEDKKKHMTEAEKSILHLRKRERMQRGEVGEVQEGAKPGTSR
jgi:DNA-directed RNA polymerase specialized sigma subunit